jgi:hypothetical protein
MPCGAGGFACVTFILGGEPRILMCCTHVDSFLSRARKRFSGFFRSLFTARHVGAPP